MFAASSLRLKIGGDAEFKRDFLEDKSYVQIPALSPAYGRRLDQAITLA